MKTWNYLMTCTIAFTASILPLAPQALAVDSRTKRALIEALRENDIRKLNTCAAALMRSDMATITNALSVVELQATNRNLLKLLKKIVFEKLKTDRTNSELLGILDRILASEGCVEDFRSFFLEVVADSDCEIPVEKLQYVNPITLKFVEIPGDKKRNIEAFEIAYADLTQFWYWVMARETWREQQPSSIYSRGVRVPVSPKNPFEFSEEQHCEPNERVILRSGQALCLNVPAVNISPREASLIAGRLTANSRDSEKYFYQLPRIEEWMRATKTSSENGKYYKFPFNLSAEDIREVARIELPPNHGPRSVGTMPGYSEEKQLGLADFTGNVFKWLGNRDGIFYRATGGAWFSGISDLVLKTSENQRERIERAQPQNGYSNSREHFIGVRFIRVKNKKP